MSIRELQAMADTMSMNSYKSLSFRINRNLWTIDIDKVWKAYHYAVSKLNVKSK